VPVSDFAVGWAGPHGGIRVYVYGLLHRSGFVKRGFSNYRSISRRNCPPMQYMGNASWKFDCFSGRHDLRSYCDFEKLDSGSVIKLYVF
jgi:hypothetical protein